MRRGVPPDARAQRALRAVPIAAVLIAAVPAAALAIPGCVKPDRAAHELVVCAATSTRDALLSLEAAFEREQGVDVVFDFGASGALASRIEASARADVFLSADASQMDRLQEAGLLLEGTRRALLSNRLAVIESLDGPTVFGAPFEAEQLAGPAVERLSLADPDSAPVGRYARAWLSMVGVWRSLAARVLPAVDARAALAAVESGAARAGVVYASDAARSARVRLVHLVPPAQGPRIAYPIALLRGAPNEPAARAFLRFLDEPAARAAFAAAGFLPAPLARPDVDPQAEAMAAVDVGATRAGPAPDAAAVSTASVLAVTLRVALGATLLAAPLGVLLGYALARRSFRGKSVVETLVALPLVLPPTAIGYLLLTLLARRAPLGAALARLDLDLLFTWQAAVLAAAVVSMPLVARTARAAFEEVDPRLERMARSMGWGPLRAFAGVTLPLARRGLMAAAVLGFGRALGEFGATVIVAGNIPGRTQTLSLAIYSEIQRADAAGALRLVAITVVLAFVVMGAVEHLLQGRARGPRRP